MAIPRKEVVLDHKHNQIRNLVRRYIDHAVSKDGYLHINADAIFSEARAITGAVDEASRVMRMLRDMLPDTQTFEVFAEGTYDGNNIVIYPRGNRPDYRKPVVNKLTDGQMARLAYALWVGHAIKPNTVFCGYKVTRANISSAQALVAKMQTGFKACHKLDMATIANSSDLHMKEAVAYMVKTVPHPKPKPKKAKAVSMVALNGTYTAAKLRKVLAAIE